MRRNFWSKAVVAGACAVALTATAEEGMWTFDTLGGNSGSPVINKTAELVGLIFDGNIESLAGDFVYDGTRNRAVSVHSAAMMEAMPKLYGASALADEINGAAH
jgi:hypothetical protein